ncbi:MAG: pyruvate formate-lyase-activating protein [Clostridia bacterium]|nr:pyruvate formate-lyase-activating protein [Clostridia bacterium]
MQPCDRIGYVHQLESFGSVDGPGVRFVVFMQGCAMRCRYCHNPETWAAGGKTWTAQELFDRVRRYRNYWGKQGGITVSGGEPLLQTEFVTALFGLARAEGIHTALDTAGQPFVQEAAYLEKFDALMDVTNLVILDLKEIDERRHRALTGHTNANILAMARYVAARGIPLWIRHVLVPGLTDDEQGLRRMQAFIDTLDSVERVEVLPYHTLGLQKWRKLRMDYSLEGVRTPTEEEMRRAQELLQTRKYAGS